MKIPTTIIHEGRTIRQDEYEGHIQLSQAYQGQTIYRHKISREFLVMVRQRHSGTNTYVQVDHEGKRIITRRDWSSRPMEQCRLITGFENLEIYKP